MQVRELAVTNRLGFARACVKVAQCANSPHCPTTRSENGCKAVLPPLVDIVLAPPP